MTKIRIFIKILSGRSTPIYVERNETISDGKKKYMTASCSSNSDPQWKMNGIVLRNDRTFESYDIEDDDNITSNDRSEGGGGEDSTSFANLSEEFIRRDDVSHNNPNIPSWRTIAKGINLYGICKNDKCIANGKQVIMPAKSKEYNIYNEGFMGICPICKKHFDLDTCSFYKCDYKVEGTYFDKYKDDWVDLPDEIRKTSGGKDFYYDFNKVVDKKEGKDKYKKLILKVIDYHKNE